MRGVEWASDLKQRFGARVETVTTKNLLRLAGCIQESDLLVASDCDASHVSAAVGTGTVTLFGPTDPQLYGPYPLSDLRNQAIAAPNGDLAQLSLESVLKEIEKRI